MSALIRESHANETQALFLSASGSSTITGNLTVDGATFLKGIVETDNTVTMFAGTTATVPSLQMVPVDAATEDIQLRSNGKIQFGTLTLATAPQSQIVTSNTPNGDVLTIGGAVIANTLAGIGPAPVSLITSTKTINPIPVNPIPATGFTVDVPVPTAVGQEYDVMARGLITLASGTPDPSDTVIIQLDAGTLASTGAVWTYQFLPATTTANGYWQIRDRIVADAVTPTLFVATQLTRYGASTANFSVSLIQFDVTRVK